MEGSLKRNAMMTYLLPKFRRGDKIASPTCKIKIWVETHFIADFRLELFNRQLNNLRKQATRSPREKNFHAVMPIDSTCPIYLASVSS